MANSEKKLPLLSHFQLFSLAVGIIGIQFAWSMQIAFSSRVLEPLGANPFLFGLIWAAGPITGVIIPPIIGAFSDKTWTKIGRRRPFIIVGTIIAAITLFLFPLAPSLVFATGLLWVMNASANAAQAPYRALVPDSVPASQQVMANSYINFAYGAGSIISLGVAPLLLLFKVPMSIVQQFLMTSIIFLLTISYSCLVVKEYPKPAEVDETKKQDSLVAMIKKFFTYDKEINKLCAIQILIWIGMQSIYIYLMPFVVHNIYGLPDMSTPQYSKMRTANKVLEPITAKMEGKSLDAKVLKLVTANTETAESLNKNLDIAIASIASIDNYWEKEIKSISELSQNDIKKEIAYKTVILRDWISGSKSDSKSAEKAKTQFLESAPAKASISAYNDFKQVKDFEKLEQKATNTAQIAIVILNTVSLLLSLPMGYFCCKFSKKLIYMISIGFAAVGCLFAPFVHTPAQVVVMALFIGVATSTVLSIPYAMLGDYLPKGEEGTSMGIFNIFIAAPQFVSAVIVGWIISQVPMKVAYGMSYNWSIAYVISSVCLFLAIFAMKFLKEKKVECE